MTRRVQLSVALVVGSVLGIGCGASPSGPQQPTDPPRQTNFDVLSGGSASDTIGAAVLTPLDVQVADTSGALLPDALVRLSGSVVGATPTLLVSTQPGGPAAAVALVEPEADGTFTVYVTLGNRAGAAQLRMTEVTTGAQASVDFHVEPGAAIGLDLTTPFEEAIVGDSVEVRSTAWDRAGNLVTRAVSLSAMGPAVVAGSGVIGTSLGTAIITGSLDGAVDTHYMRFLPRGHIVYNNNSHIVASRLDGSRADSVDTEFTRIVDAAPVGRLAAFARNGRLYYASFPDVVLRITQPAIENIVSQERHPAFAHDGHVYFMALGDHIGWAVWRVDEDGTNPEQLTFPVADSLSHRYPAPSTQGDRIVYVQGADEGPGPLFVHDVASGVATPLGVTGLFSRWSPDDEWIAYADALGRLRRIRPDGNDDQEIVHEPGAFPQPFGWSPDGQYIVASNAELQPRLIVVETGEVISLDLGGSVDAMSWYATP